MNQDWESRVQALAKAMPYPPTPDIGAGLSRRRHRNLRRLAQVAAVLLMVAAALLAVPEIRAGIAAFLRIGAVRVAITTATTATPPAQFNGSLPDSVLDFPGATTLDDARAHFGHPIPIPSALGAPDRVYLIGTAPRIVVLAWLDANGAVDASLHLLPSSAYALKMTEGNVTAVRLNGRDALWIAKPHAYMLQVSRNRYQMRKVNMNALVWESADGSITYRLETDRSLDEAILIVRSIGES